MRQRQWSRDPVLSEDLERIAASDQTDWEALRGKRVLVTGATGLIGGITVRALVAASAERNLGIRVTAPVRSLEKGRALLGAFLEDGLELIKGDVLSPLCVEGSVDYILHGAGMTASRDFVSRPVETIRTALEGTEHLLELAREKKVAGMVYLSSMEVYGAADPEKYTELGGAGGAERTAAVMRETDYGYVDPLVVRSSYSESKRMAEGLCAAYCHEYGVPVKTARLAQTFGAGISESENRVFAQFARSILEGRDLVLHTDGSKAHCYCYTTDAVLGLLTVLLRGRNGEAYNISNEDTYGTIREMADMLVRRYPQSGSGVVFDIPEDEKAFGYAPSSRMMICSEKLRALGWHPQIGLPEMFDRLMASLSYQKQGEGTDGKR